MEHLNLEAMARLLDEPASDEERTHLNRCRRCREELDALRSQRLVLSHLPEMRPPAGDWDRLEPRLRAKGLLRESQQNPGRAPKGPGGWGGFGAHPWLQAAAAVLLLVTGVGLGAGLPLDGWGSGARLASETPAGAVPSASVERPQSILAAVAGTDRELSLEESAELVRLMEHWYLEALREHRNRAQAEQMHVPDDPITRFAALETLMAAGHQAVRELPADPFLNGLLVNMQAERDATLRGIQASTTRNWY